MKIQNLTKGFKSINNLKYINFEQIIDTDYLNFVRENN